MTPSRERVNKKRLNSELEIIKQMVPVSCQETVKVCELYLSASEKMPEKKKCDSHGNRMFGNFHPKCDVCYEAKIHNEAIDLMTPLVMRLQGRVEELEKRECTCGLADLCDEMDCTDESSPLSD